MKTDQKIPAIILSQGQGGLGALRSLARKRVPVMSIAYSASELELYSRWGNKIKLKEHDDQKKEAELLNILLNIQDNGQVLLTTSDRLVSFLSRHEFELKKKFHFRLPPADLLNALNDKRQETELVEKLGFPIPGTVNNLPSDPTLLLQQLRLPIIIKPYSYEVRKIFPLKNKVVKQKKELYEFYQMWQKSLPALLAQEVIPGPDSNSWICSCTFDEDHQLLDCAIKQKLRALPPHFGGSTYAISRKNPEVKQLTRDLGMKLQYIGHAGIEFRFDNRDKTYKFIELNPRIPDNVGFDEDSGLCTVWNSYLVALCGKGHPSNIEQREGIFFLDFWRDLESQFRDKDPILLILYRYLNLLLKPKGGIYFEWDDPFPGFVAFIRKLVFITKTIIKKI
jgi:predicted ATP-grasp superfamily ATP-dependent carboligase